MRALSAFLPNRLLSTITDNPINLDRQEVQSMKTAAALFLKGLSSTMTSVATDAPAETDSDILGPRHFAELLCTQLRTIAVMRIRGRRKSSVSLRSRY